MPGLQINNFIPMKVCGREYNFFSADESGTVWSQNNFVRTDRVIIDVDTACDKFVCGVPGIALGYKILCTQNEDERWIL